MAVVECNKASLITSIDPWCNALAPATNSCSLVHGRSRHADAVIGAVCSVAALLRRPLLSQPVNGFDLRAKVRLKPCRPERVSKRWLRNEKPGFETVAANIRCHYTKSNPIDDHSNISSKTLQKQNFKPLGHYTCMQCGTSHLQTVQENIRSHIVLAIYRKFTVATVRFTQNVTGNIFTHPIYQQVANVTV